MSKTKDFIIDTNALLESEDTIEILMNGKDGDIKNKIFIPYTCIEELDGLKKNIRLRPMVMRTIETLNKYKDDIIVIKNGNRVDSNDNKILQELDANKHKFENPIFITNDKMLQFKVASMDIPVEEFKASNPFQSDSELWTGFTEELDEECINSFYFKEGILHFWNGEKEKSIHYENTPWNIKPRDAYQNAALELILNKDIPLVSIQSSAGKGKTWLSLSCALNQVLEKKKYKKIYIFKNVIEIGPSLGFLPGKVDEKIEPFTKHLQIMLDQLHELRPGNNDVFLEQGIYNTKYIEILPLTYIRGMNLEDSFVIIEESQNNSREDMRSLLTRMGKNCKCICIGDTNQVDSSHLNQMNNGLNWIVKQFKGHKDYAHVVLRGKETRGPICNLVVERGL